MLPGVNGGMVAGVNGGMANAAIPGVMAGGLNQPLVAGAGVRVLGQPQFAQVRGRGVDRIASYWSAR